MLKTMSRILILACLLPLTAMAAGKWVEGKHYERLPAVVPTLNKEQVEINEMFWYGCPHCYKLEPLIQPWSKKLPKGVYFTQTPAMFGPLWKTHAQFYYAMKVLKLDEHAISAVFTAYHEQKNSLDTVSKMIAFVKPYGVSAKQFNKAYKSFGVKNQMQQAFAKARAYGLEGVPAIVVNGKFIISAQSAGGNRNMLKVAKYLAQQELKK